MLLPMASPSAPESSLLGGRRSQVPTIETPVSARVANQRTFFY